jgi:hypothetical protein
VARPPEYWREYRRHWSRAHRAGENARKARNRAIPGWRAAHEHDHRPPAAAPEPIPSLHLGHPLFDQARRFVQASTMTILCDPLPDDLMSEAVLALLEGRDPKAAVARYRKCERSWQEATCPLTEWL